jgi:hypothetical protein
VKLSHGDVFTIIDRSFRFEIPNQTGKSPAKSPGKNLKNSLFTPVKGSPNKGFGTPKVCTNPLLFITSRGCGNVLLVPREVTCQLFLKQLILANTVSGVMSYLKGIASWISDR